ncbi:transposase [Microbacterium candidum]|uniref:transposase n=1 Tax=Microbacterium candidum TaxID=3041922 RepID=UPI003B02513A
MTTEEVAAHFDDVYGASLSKDAISKITEKGDRGDGRPSEPAAGPGDHLVVFIDAIVVKIRDGQVRNKPFHVAVGVTRPEQATSSGSGPAPA